MPSITSQTRWDSFEKLDRNRMYSLILNVVYRDKSEEGLTAREIAIILYEKGLTRSNERGQVQPRLTELVDRGDIEVVGKKYDNLTERKVATYKKAS